MSDKYKHKKPHTHPNEGSGKQDPCNRDVRVHGAIEVHPPLSLIDQHNTERTEDKTQQNKNYVISKLTLISVIVYAFLTLAVVVVGIFSNKISRDAMRQSQRPWIGPYKQIPLITGPIIIDDKGMIRTDYRMSAVNYGSYGANNVSFWAQLYVAQDISTRSRRTFDPAVGWPSVGWCSRLGHFS